MPSYKGLSVSIHANGRPLPEYSVQKQSRVSRVNAYIPVPPAKIPKDGTSNKPEPSTFAISITLLTPGLPVPYSRPLSSKSNPYPQPQIVGGLPSSSSDRGNSNGVIAPYMPLTKSDNETIAAYIYFDGRGKEEVATLLRPGEETWVNSRWVQVPDAEGGGLAEREFLFREVGLERWLNGLDLDGQDAPQKLERRRQKFEKRRKRKLKKESKDSDDELDLLASSMNKTRQPDVLRYGTDERSPVEKLSDDDDMSDLDSDDDNEPEATGQIKVAMFRVLASGEIKKGEYSPQFDAHDDDDPSEGSGQGTNGEKETADADHTTSFAKPKTLDPSSISTQTVTGIDGPDKPYATFTFFYRGERQLQKMGILDSSKSQKPAVASAKRNSTQLDFGNLAPLKSGGTVGFQTFRDVDPAARKNKSRKKSNGDIGGAMEEDSEEDEDDTKIVGEMEDIEDKNVKTLLSPEDAKFQGELADGVGRIKLKRQHSAEDITETPRKSPSVGALPPGGIPPSHEETVKAFEGGVGGQGIKNGLVSEVTDESIVGSPLKKHRASLYNTDADAISRLLSSTPFSGPATNVLDIAEASQAAQVLAAASPIKNESEQAMKMEDEEEL